MRQSVLRISRASAVLLLTACGTTSVPPQWAGNNGNFPRDNYECVRDSRVTAGGPALGVWSPGDWQRAAKDQATKLYRMCMESKGYRYVCPVGYRLNDDHDKCKPGDKTLQRLDETPPRRVEPWCAAGCLAKLLVGDWEVVGEPQRRLHLSWDGVGSDSKQPNDVFTYRLVDDAQQIRFDKKDAPSIYRRLYVTSDDEIRLITPTDKEFRLRRVKGE